MIRRKSLELVVAKVRVVVAMELEVEAAKVEEEKGVLLVLVVVKAAEEAMHESLDLVQVVKAEVKVKVAQAQVAKAVQEVQLVLVLAEKVIKLERNESILKMPQMQSENQKNVNKNAEEGWFMKIESALFHPSHSFGKMKQ
jgi:glutaredoxin 2